MKVLHGATAMKALLGPTAKKTYIRLTTDIVNLRLTYPFLDGIGIHHSLGLEEDAANGWKIDDEEGTDYYEGDPFFMEFEDSY